MQKKFQAYILNQSSNFCGLIIFLKLNLALPAAHTFLLLQQMLSNLQTEPLSPIPSTPSISASSSASSPPLSPSSHDSASNTSPLPDWNRVNCQFHQFNHQNHHHCHRHQFTIAAIANLDHPCQSPDNLQPKKLPLLLVPMSPISDFFRSARTSRSTLDFRIRGHGQGGHGP